MQHEISPEQQRLLEDTKELLKKYQNGTHTDSDVNQVSANLKEYRLLFNRSLMGDLWMVR